MDITEKLISLVQPHRCLYDCRDKDYKNSMRKEKLWDFIAKQLNQSCDNIKMKWKNLKDGYTKYVKNNKDTSSQKKPYANWIWGPYLNFLDGTIQHRTSVTNVFVSPDYSESPEFETKMIFTNSAEFDTDSPTSNYGDDSELNNADIKNSPYEGSNSSIEESQSLLTPYTPSARKRRASNTEDNVLEKLLGYLGNKEKKDSVDLLFASYAKSLKKMKPMTQATVKIKLAQVFADAELQDLQTEN